MSLRSNRDKKVEHSITYTIMRLPHNAAASLYSGVVK